MMDTLDFTVSEHWVPFSFPWSMAFYKAIVRASFTFLSIYHLVMCWSLIIIDHWSKNLKWCNYATCKSIIGEEQKNIDNK